MAAIRRFEDIVAWKEARKLASEVYAVANRAPLAQDFALKNQILRAAISVSSNIAEGFDRGSDKAFVSFLQIARGSASEVRSQLYLAQDLGYVTEEEMLSLKKRCESVSYAITGFIQYLRKAEGSSTEVHDSTVPYDFDFHGECPDNEIL